MQVCVTQRWMGQRPIGSTELELGTETVLQWSRCNENTLIISAKSLRAAISVGYYPRRTGSALAHARAWYAFPPSQPSHPNHP